MDSPTVNPDPTSLLAAAYAASADDYARVWAPVIQPMGQRLVAAIPFGRAATILDVGVGSGGLVGAIRAAAPAARIIGIDRTAGMLAVARQAFPALPVAVADAQELGLRSATVEAAILAFVLQHLPDPGRGLSEVARVLRRGGQLAAATWGADRLLPASEIWDSELDAAGAKPATLPDAVQQHALVDTPEKVGHLLLGAGLMPDRLWIERFERAWTWQELFAVRSESGFGIHRRRLHTLPEEARRRCLDRVRERAMRLPPADLVWRPEVVYALARRP
jgi:SAM-dependent methyltransferase